MGSGDDLVPLAFSGESPANQHLYITFDREKTYLRPDSIGDMFFKKLDISLPGQTVHEVNLNRIVGKIKVIIKDPIPASISRIEVSFFAAPTAYDVFTGKAHDARSSVVLNHFVMPEDIGKKNLTFGITSWQNALGIYITAFDAKNKYAFAEIIKPVNLKTNTMITYIGNVFKDVQGFHIQADTTWNSKVILPFPGQ